MNEQEIMESIEKTKTEVETLENEWDSKYSGTNFLKEVASKYALLGDIYGLKIKDYGLAGVNHEKAAGIYERIYKLERSAKHFEKASENFDKATDALYKASKNFEKSTEKYDVIKDNRFLQGIERAIYNCSEAERLYKVAGKNDKSDKMYVRKHELEKKYLNKKRKKLKFVKNLIWGKFTNYGTSFKGLGILAIILYLSFSLVYWKYNLITLSLISDEKSLNYSTTIADALYFSATNLIGINYGELVPKPLLGRLAAVIEGVIGIGLITVFIAIATNKIIKSDK